MEYKAKLNGIKVVKINESYTSGCSALDLEKTNVFSDLLNRREIMDMWPILQN
ncbi:zinc ribbon domain-containing protein [Halanaerobium saccharolyticum]|uniref:zinc ribbon domain-containing protein n=1 Tax=Halanaerobium saccharolyticum TaxID=43595 RepID=UPI0038991829